jgi:hypothetical protein
MTLLVPPSTYKYAPSGWLPDLRSNAVGCLYASVFFSYKFINIIEEGSDGCTKWETILAIRSCRMPPPQPITKFNKQSVVMDSFFASMQLLGIVGADRAEDRN